MCNITAPSTLQLQCAQTDKHFLSFVGTLLPTHSSSSRGLQREEGGEKNHTHTRKKQPKGTHARTHTHEQIQARIHRPNSHMQAPTHAQKHTCTYSVGLHKAG